PAANINTFYNTLPGVTSTIQSGPVTPASLAGVDLFVSAIPAVPFTASEVSALAAFSTGGGSIFLLGDDAAFAARNQNLNRPSPLPAGHTPTTWPATGTGRRTPSPCGTAGPPAA